MATTETRPGEGAARERKVDAFVFDCVCHVFNFDKANALGPPGELFDEHLYAFHQLLTREGEPILSRDEFFKEWSVDVHVVWDPVWTPERLSPSARDALSMPLEQLEPYRRRRLAAERGA